MARATIRTDLGGGRWQYSYVDLPDAPREPGEPLDWSDPWQALWGTLILLFVLVMLVLVVRAANEPNPGDPDYVQPSSSHSVSIEDDTPQ